MIEQNPKKFLILGLMGISIIFIFYGAFVYANSGIEGAISGAIAVLIGELIGLFFSERKGKKEKLK